MHFETTGQVSLGPTRPLAGQGSMAGCAWQYAAVQPLIIHDHDGKYMTKIMTITLIVIITNRMIKIDSNNINS
jgi:hypothetical protein